MSLTPAVLDALLAAGATADMIVAAVKADMAEGEARKVEKRAGNAERQRRFKAKRRGTADNASNALPAVTPPNDIGSNPPELIPSEAKASLPRRGRAARLPDDWTPEPLTGEVALMVAAWPVGMIERELSKFKDYWKSANGRKAAKLDWQAAWRFWLTNADDWTLKNDRKQSPSRGGSTRDAAQLALARMGHG